MSQTEYKLLFDGTAATAEQLERFETVTVIQDAERPSQARLEVSVCLDDQGNWTDDDEPFMQILHRVRVELKVGEADFVPLIDGPIMGFDSERRSMPGQSTVTVVVQDDSALLNRVASVAAYPPGAKDSAIAEQIFGEYAEIASTEIEETPDAPDPLPPELRRRGTDMSLLRQLARRSDFVCAVIPGAEPGSSIGIFHSTPVFEDEPPPLVLLGRDRNIESFDVQLNAQGQSNVVASTLSFSDKQTVTRRSQAPDLGAAGEELLRPGTGESVDLQHRVDREARRRGRAIEATGSVRRGCYTGILSPLHPVTVQLGTTQTSGTYVIQKVTHRLGRSEYTQEFMLVSDALTEVAAGGALIPAGLF